MANNHDDACLLMGLYQPMPSSFNGINRPLALLYGLKSKSFTTIHCHPSTINAHIEIQDVMGGVLHVEQDTIMGIKRLKIEYLDLYLIHWPINVKPGDWETPYTKDLISAFNLTGVWKQMEECKKLGLAKSIGVSNFTCKKLKDLLSFATIPPSVNQKKLKEFCDEKGIIITAFSPLGAKGASWGSNVVMDSEILKEIAKAHGRTIAQVCQWWVGRYDGPEGFTTLVMRLQTMGFR
ncbi:hypothetical protein JHK84_027722 [Glycine max]|nr:hypothetical protein JHK84_027722 [Glycine max]